MRAVGDVEIHVADRCETVMDRLAALFEAEGLRVYQSFDLQTAMQRLPNCGCPYHGHEACTCQYAVWLVYPPEGAPVLLVLHGRDEETWITLPEETETSRVHEIVRSLVQSYTPVK